MPASVKTRSPASRKPFHKVPEHDAIIPLIAAVGTETFYHEVFRFVSEILGCDRWILARYGQFAKPEILINCAIPDELVQLYLGGLYRLDPLLRVVAEGNPPPVVTFEKLCKDGWGDGEYTELYRMCQVRDEIVIFMPELVGTHMAFCFDHQSHRFTSAEVDHVLAQYPVLSSLHRLHVERSLARELEETNEEIRRILLTNSRGEILHRSNGWTEPERSQVDRIVASLAESGDTSSPLYLNGHVLHWEELPETNHLAPGGRMFLLERSSPGYIQGGMKSSLEEFSKIVNLTPREQDLVNLTLRGYPTSAIAEKLDLTAGTVKVYKHRLYEKLDITSEREIFLQFIEFLFDHPGSL